MTNLIRIISVVCILLTPLMAAAADFSIIVNKDNPVSSISKSEIGRIFMGKTNKFSKGSTAIPVNQSFASGVRALFDKEILNRSEVQIKAYWNQQLFSGDGTPPEEFDNDAAVIDRVASDASAIGYISSAHVSDSVKVLSVE